LIRRNFRLIYVAAVSGQKASTISKPSLNKAVNGTRLELPGETFGDDRVEGISLQGVTKIFGGDPGQTPVVAVDNVSFRIEAGEFLCVIGPSGCGKSTLLMMLAGLTMPTTGKILKNGHPIEGPGPDRIVMFQEYGLYPWMTVRQNIEFGLEAKGMAAKARAKVSQLYIEMVNLVGFEDRYPHQISGGMKQRVAIARSLAPDPEVVIMDEPFAALDSLTRDLLQEEILQIWERTQKTFVLITHNIEEAIFLGDRVLVMSARPGKIKHIENIDIPRPRDAATRANHPKFLQYREQLAGLLRTEIQHEA
jgi:NitT/TauT family transport system ATP-binding protein